VRVTEKKMAEKLAVPIHPNTAIRSREISDMTDPNPPVVSMPAIARIHAASACLGAAARCRTGHSMESIELISVGGGSLNISNPGFISQKDVNGEIPQ